MQIRNQPVKFIVFAAILLVLIFVVENINKHFWLNDLRVYYSAAQALMHGEQVYGVAFGLGSGYYKYSPFTSFLFIPYALLPYKAAAVIHYFILSFAIISLFLLVWQIVNTHLFNNKVKNMNALLFAAFVCTLVHLVRELHLGNINVIILLMLSLSLPLILKSKQAWAGVLLAVVIITKPFFILLLIPLVLRKYFKTIFSMSITMIAFVLLPAIFIGISKDITLHKEWINTMLEHNAAFPSNNTIKNIVRLYANPEASNALSYIILTIVCIGSTLFFFVNNSFQKRDEIQVSRRSAESTEKYEKESYSATSAPLRETNQINSFDKSPGIGNNEKSRNASFIIEWFVLIALMPSLFKTDTQHFLLSLPLLMILLCYLSLAKNYILTTAFVVLMLMYGGNMPDLIGKAFSGRLEATGILGISNLIIITATILIYFKFLRKPIEH